MSTYNRNALADSNNNILWNKFGEVLRLVDSEDISMDYLESVLQRPNIKTRYRLLILNPDESVNYEIPQEDIIINSGSFTENYQSGQRKSLTIDLVNTDGKYTPSTNSIWVHNRLRLDVGLEFDGNLYWFPRGVYVLNNPTDYHVLSDKKISLSLSDKFAIFEGKSGTLETTYEIPVDSDIEGVIKGILGIDSGSGYPLDSKPVFYDNNLSGIKMPYTLTKDAGSTFGEILLEIGVILNAELYYNSQGNFCVVAINETSDDYQKAPMWDYEEGKNDYFDSNINYDFENAVNEIHVVGDNILNDLFYAKAVNDNPLSPICVQRVGRRIDYINDSGIYSDDLAKQRAQYELRKKMILGTILNVSVAFNPLLFVNNIVTITDSHYKIKKERYIIQSISYTLGNDSVMSLSCSNVNERVNSVLQM